MKTKKLGVKLIVILLLIVSFAVTIFIFMGQNRSLKMQTSNAQTQGLVSDEGCEAQAIGADEAQPSDAEKMSVGEAKGQTTAGGVLIEYEFNTVNKGLWGDDYLKVYLKGLTGNLPKLSLEMEFRDKPSAGNANKFVNVVFEGGKEVNTRYDVGWNRVESIRFKLSCNGEVVCQADLKV